MHRAPRIALTAASLVLALVVSLTALVATPATAATLATVSGKVVMSPQAAATITFFPVDGTASPRTFTSFPDGTWSGQIAPGRYDVRYAPAAAGSAMGIKWLDGTHYRVGSETLVVPTSGVSGLYIVLDSWPTWIGGTAKAGGAPAPSARIDLFIFDETIGRYETYPYRTANASVDGTFRINGLVPASYLLRVTSDPLGGVRSTSLYLNGGGFSTTFNLPIAGVEVTRLAGVDRFDTAAAISRSTSRPRAIFIVNGLNYPDALGAGPAAAKLTAPILLTYPDRIPATTLAEIERIAVTYGRLPIYVIGGPGTVSDAVFSQLGAYATAVERVSGADRYATSRAVIYRFFDDVPGVLLANGRNYPDALAGGPAAAAQGSPILLVDGGAPRLDAGALDLLQDVQSPTALLGGTGAVSTGIESQLMAAQLPAVRRLAGADRYSTGASISTETFGAADTVYLASGTNFPDALAATSTAARNSSPVLLVTKTCIPRSAYAELQRLRPDRIILLGGTGVLGSGVASLTRCST